MSVDAMTAVFRHSQSKGSARLVLLSMADEANGQGLLTAYRRSRSWLAAKANVDSGTVRRAIVQLVELGEVEVLAQGDGRASSDYRICLPGLDDEGGRDAPPAPADDPPRGSDVPPQGVQDAPPIIPVSPVDSPVVPNHSRANGVLDAGFAEFWKGYPIKVAKGAAERAWPKAVKAAGSIGVLVRAAEGYRDDPNRDPAYTKHASTWLRGKCWGDPPLPSRRNGQAPFRPDTDIITDRTGTSRRIDL